MSVHDHDDRPLVELVSVNGAAVEPGTARPGGTSPGETGPDGTQLFEDRQPASRRGTRLLALAAVAVAGAGVLTAVLTRPGPVPTPVAATTTTEDTPITPIAPPSGGSVSELLARAQQKAEARQRAEAQHQQEAAQTAIDELTGMRALRPPMMSCPGTVTSCTVEFGRLPAAVTAAVTARIPGARLVHAVDATGYDGDRRMYFRQLRLSAGGCVITVQLTRVADDVSGTDGWDTAVRTGSGQLAFTQHPAADGFVARFRLGGTATACPSDGVLSRLAADPRLLRH